MRFIHISDLHFGKSLHKCPLVERDQPHWTEGFLRLVDSEKPDAVVIAGDVYDRSSPSNEAVALMDELLTALSQRGITVMMIAGNHDSGQKLSFGGRLLQKQGLHIAGVPSREIAHVSLNDAHGEVVFWLMPYIFPAAVSALLEDEDIRDYDTAVRALLGKQNIDFSKRNVLVAHQNVLAFGEEAQRGGSETMIGGVGGIDYTAFDGFTYVALGHIHAAQYVGRPEVRYAGSPLCYHFSETKQPRKGPLLVELGAAGTQPIITRCDIPPLHPMRELRGSFDEIMAAELESGARDEYLRVVLTDGILMPDAADRLRAVFASHGSVALEIVSESPGDASARSSSEAARQKSVDELFCDFFFERTGEKTPDRAQLDIISYVAEHTSRAQCSGGVTFPTESELDALVSFILGEE